MTDFGRVGFAETGSHASRHAGCAVDGPTGFDPARELARLAKAESHFDAACKCVLAHDDAGFAREMAAFWNATGKRQ